MSRMAHRGPSSAAVRAVPLVLESVSEPDAEPDMEAHQQSTDPFSPSPIRFASDCHSDSVHLSADRLSAHHVSSAEDTMFGVVLSEGPLAESSTGYYFELSIDAVQEEKIGGLALGVTTTRPANLESLVPGLPEAAVEVPDCWCVGFYGAAYCSARGHGRFTDVTWDPQILSLGDRVGLHLTSDGVISIVQNGEIVAQGPDVVPTHGPLYAVVDLLGKTAGVSIVPGAVAPCLGREPPLLPNNSSRARDHSRPRVNGSSSSQSRAFPLVSRAVARSRINNSAPSCATERRRPSSSVGGFKPNRPVPPRPSPNRASPQIPVASNTSQSASRHSCGYLNVPVASARSRSKAKKSPAKTPRDVTVDECSICLEQMKVSCRLDSSVRCLPCSHRFHKNCIDHWLECNSTCPMCRSDIS